MLERAGPWGQQFPRPCFVGDFEVQSSRILKQKHLKLVLKSLGGGPSVDAILFQADARLLQSPLQRVEALYELSVNRFRGRESLQLMLRDLRPRS